MKVLAFDCAGAGLSAAVVDGEAVVARSAAMERGQAEALMPMIQDVLGAAGLAVDDLDLIGVTVGPGSFTGVRIGLAAARGLALACSLPLIGVTSFAAFAAAYPPARRKDRPLVVALESKRDELFLQCFDGAGAIRGQAAMISPAEAETMLPAGPLILVGDAAQRLAPWLGVRAVLAGGATLADPVDIARLALAQFVPGTMPAPPRPLYLRAPDTTLPRTAQR